MVTHSIHPDTVGWNPGLDCLLPISNTVIHLQLWIMKIKEEEFNLQYYYSDIEVTYEF